MFNGEEVITGIYKTPTNKPIYLGKETVELLKNLGFKNIELKKDMYGNDRMIRCKK